MKEETVIDLQHVTMTFRRLRRHYGIKSAILHPFQLTADRLAAKPFKAIDDVTISVRRGERIGLVGHNGCGKTTLLSLIGGVYRRFGGKVSVRGRLAMMLALGSGFSDQLSGRDNIILNGVLQGKTRAEMADLMEDIASFADIGEFIDAPLCQYSSGMLARIGFAVATAIQPEILLVDEVMAVGDSDFRKRCERRISGLLANGTTLILVSHSVSDIRKYCDRVIKLDHGRVVADGPTWQVVGGARPKVSVVVLLRGSAEDIEKSLDSVVKQTLREIEVLCVDASASASALAVARRFAAADLRFRIRNIGAVSPDAQANAGLEMAMGTYVHFMSPGEKMPPNFLSKMFARARSCRASVVVCGRMGANARRLPRAWCARTQPIDPASLANSILSVVGAGPGNLLVLKDYLQKSKIVFRAIGDLFGVSYTVAAVVGTKRLALEPGVAYHTVIDMPDLKTVFAGLCSVRGGCLNARGYLPHYADGFRRLAADLVVEALQRSRTGGQYVDNVKLVHEKILPGLGLQGVGGFENLPPSAELVKMGNKKDRRC